jgi:hypothetical protein
MTGSGTLPFHTIMINLLRIAIIGWDPECLPPARNLKVLGIFSILHVSARGINIINIIIIIWMGLGALGIPRLGYKCATFWWGACEKINE